MYCPNCRNNVGEDKFCSNCGAGIPCIAESPVEKFNMISAYKSMFKKYTQFSGRSRRSEYWYAMLTHSIILSALVIWMCGPIMYDVITYGEPLYSTMPLFFTAWAITLVYMLATLVPNLSLTVRRLHDTGRSLWFLLLGLIPYVGEIVIFVFTVLDSQPGVNKYGPNPKGK